ncbi:MAG TPA: ABC transporter ATP-binding protein [Firmicutes bacterium]|nr:ABC transporter ATP-binding protein [Bacillota bacterium]
MSLLEIHNLSKSYPTFSLKDISFTMKKGEITGFIGRNGAGKTTTIKAIAGLIKKDAGTILFDGKKIESQEEETKEKMSLLFGGIDFYPTQKVKTLTEVTRRFYAKWDETLYRKWLGFFEIDENKRIKELSNGMKVKYGLALALSHEAELLLLDEPTSGLDPVSRDELLDILKAIAKKKETAILFSTHVISDLEKCANQIVYIKKGSLLASKSLSSFKEDYICVSGERLSIAKEEAMLHFIKKEANSFEGISKKEKETLFADDTIRKPTLEEIMIAEERGQNNEESPL